MAIGRALVEAEADGEGSAAAVALSTAAAGPPAASAALNAAQACRVSAESRVERADVDDDGRVDERLDAGGNVLLDERVKGRVADLGLWNGAGRELGVLLAALDDVRVVRGEHELADGRDPLVLGISGETESARRIWTIASAAEIGGGGAEAIAAAAGSASGEVEERTDAPTAEMSNNHHVSHFQLRDTVLRDQRSDQRDDAPRQSRW